MGRYKDEHKKTRLGAFIKNNAPKLLDAVEDVLPERGALGVVKNLISNSSELTPEEKEAAKGLAELDLKAFELEVEDRKSARADGDRHLQRVVAYFSLLGFTIFGGIQVWLSYKILQNSLEVNEFVIMTASNIFGIFTGLIFTLKDFLFGGSIKAN
jgi:hypothetical protein